MLGTRSSGCACAGDAGSSLVFCPSLTSALGLVGGVCVCVCVCCIIVCVKNDCVCMHACMRVWSYACVCVYV